MENSYSLFLGIDPGREGGLASISREGKVLATLAMPDTLRVLWNFINMHTGKDKKILCGLEKVHAMPLQGVTSMFNFGRRYGYLEAYLAATDIKRLDILPQEWHKGLKIVTIQKETKPDHKKRLLNICMKMFPDLDDWTMTGKHKYSICDALLIAEYIRRKHVTMEKV